MAVSTFSAKAAAARRSRFTRRGGAWGSGSSAGGSGGAEGSGGKDVSSAVAWCGMCVRDVRPLLTPCSQEEQSGGTARTRTEHEKGAARSLAAATGANWRWRPPARGGRQEELRRRLPARQPAGSPRQLRAVRRQRVSGAWLGRRQAKRGTAGAQNDS
jgi:hypothetical protein